MKERLQNLNKQLRTLVDTFIKENNLTCDKCSNYIKGKCKAKTYCIVGKKTGLWISYSESNNNQIRPPMTERQKDCIEWIEEELGIEYRGENPSDFIGEHIEEARFKSELEREAELSNLTANGDC